MKLKLNKEHSKVQVQKISPEEINEIMHMINAVEMEVKGDPYLMMVLALREELNTKFHGMTYPTKNERSFQMSIAQAIAMFVLLNDLDAPLAPFGHVVYRDLHAQLHQILLELDVKLQSL